MPTVEISPSRRLRRTALTLVALVLPLLPAAAQAVTLQVIGVSGANPAAMSVGETITIDVRVVADADAVYGLGVSAYGYDEAVVDYVDGSGLAVASIFHAVAIPPATALIGLDNAIGNPLLESVIGGNDPRVWLFTGTSLSPANAQPLDPGLDGVVGGGDAQFRVTFQAVAPGATQIVFGTGYEGDAVVLADGVQIQAVSGIVAVSVLGTTAVPSLQGILLYGLLPALLVGAALAAVRRHGELGG